ncbi:hypothetical protein BC830DRAFT_115864 [Chytriomyces sp. MP71]|nr:hypothetical protein BC830DRAFT_115864 [Chytriomyces sp. MP71]
MTFCSKSDKYKQPNLYRKARLAFYSRNIQMKDEDVINEKGILQDKGSYSSNYQDSDTAHNIQDSRIGLRLPASRGSGSSSRVCLGRTSNTLVTIPVHTILGTHSRRPTESLPRSRVGVRRACVYALLRNGLHRWAEAGSLSSVEGSSRLGEVDLYGRETTGKLGCDNLVEGRGAGGRRILDNDGGRGGSFGLHLTDRNCRDRDGEEEVELHTLQNPLRRDERGTDLSVLLLCFYFFYHFTFSPFRRH